MPHQPNVEPTADFVFTVTDQQFESWVDTLLIFTPYDMGKAGTWWVDPEYPLAPLIEEMATELNTHRAALAEAQTPSQRTPLLAGIEAIYERLRQVMLPLYSRQDQIFRTAGPQELP